MHEARYHENNCFITLTYRDEDLPLCRSLCKQILQRFIKRLRKYLGEQKIKYYACGEYGSLFEREHYHLIVFGWQPPLEDLYLAYIKKGKKYYGSRIISTLWTHGYNTVGTVTPDSCQYVAGYVKKGPNITNLKRMLKGRLQPFALQSTGLGAYYAYENREKIKANLSVIEGKKNFGLPRYYQRIIGVDTDMLREKSLKKEYERYQFMKDLGWSHNDIMRIFKEESNQKEIDLVTKDNIKELRK